MKKKNQEFKNKIISLIEKSGSATLITLSKKGFPRARVLEDHNPHPDFVFWFATHSTTRKVKEIEAHPEASVYYLLPEVGGYICILGRAEVKTDPESKKYLWREGWEKYWPQGPESEEYVPIRIVPHQVEYYNSEEKAFTNEGYGPLIFASSEFLEDD